MSRPIAAVGPVLVALRTTDPARWRTEVRAALREHGGTAGAAVALQVTQRTLNRWIAAEPDLLDGIALDRAPGRKTDPA